jgi:hypothetical protein
VFKLRGKGNVFVAGDSAEISAKIVGEIQRDLLGLPGIQPAETVNADESIVDEVRPHLQHHDAGTLLRDFLLLPGDFLLLPDDFLLAAAVLLYLIGQNEAVYSQCGEDMTEPKERQEIDEQQHSYRDRDREYGDEESEKDFPGKPLPALYYPSEREKLDRDQLQQNELVQGAAVILVFQCEIKETFEERGAYECEKQDGIQGKHGVKEPARTQIFPTAVQQISCLHGQRHREQQRFQKQQKNKYPPRNSIILEDHLHDAGQADEHKNDKIAQEKSPAPAIELREDGSEPQSHHT